MNADQRLSAFIRGQNFSVTFAELTCFRRRSAAYGERRRRVHHAVSGFLPEPMPLSGVFIGRPRAAGAGSGTGKFPATTSDGMGNLAGWRSALLALSRRAKPGYQRVSQVAHALPVV